MKVLQNSMSSHNETNPDRLKLANYSRTICNTKNFEVQSFGRENFVDLTSIRQICQTFSTVKILRYMVVT